MTEVKQWQQIGTRQLADCRIFTVDAIKSISPKTDAEHEFYAINTADWVNIVPITADNELVCIRQYRHGSAEITLEIPGGMVDAGELPKPAAARECLEETGYEALNLSSLGVLNPNPAIFTNKLHTFIARDVKKIAEISNTSTEHTEVVLVPMDKVPQKLLSGEIDHSLVAATLWRALFLKA